MSKDNYTFDDLEDILAEFSGRNEVQPESIKAADEVKETKEIKEAKKEAPPVLESTAQVVEETIIVPALKEEKPAGTRAEEKQGRAAKRAGSSFEEFEALFSREKLKKEAAEKQAAMVRNSRRAEMPGMSNTPERKASTAPKAAAKPQPEVKKPAASKKEERQQAKAEKDKAKAEKKAQKPAPVMEAPAPVVEPKIEERKKFSPLHALLSLVFACLSLLMLSWVLFNLHPASGSSVTTASEGTVLRLSDKLDVYMNNVASDALGELAYIKKIYTLQESDTVAPVPAPENFGRTTDVAVIQDVIKRAAHLLDGQSVSFDPNADFVPGEEFMYYLDDTIMVIAWKEYINERCCTMAEVKVAHGSQIRRKLAEDSYSSSVQYYASDMAKAANAVIAINGDFYAFRDLGITVYQRKLYRNNPATVDSCFFTASGDMLFSRAGELMGEGEAQKFIEDNDVVFAIAFGPVLVDNGELQYCESYPIGEINSEYSRSCIGMTDELHYLLMTINHTQDGRPRATINELARFIYSKGVQKAYTLDGGQTAEIVMFGGPINHVDFGYERTVSDIIYFATAIPNEEVQ